MIISSVMTPCPYTISAEKTVDDALKVMKLRNIRHLPIISGDEIIGVLNKKSLEIINLVCKTAEFSPSLGDFCTDEPFVVADDMGLSEVVTEMEKKKNDCALIVDGTGNFVGIFTITDVCRVLSLLLQDTGR